MRLFSALFLIVLLSACKQGNDRIVDTKELSASQLSKQYCSSCHLYPQPDLLDKNTWHEFVLPRMGAFMGIYTDRRKYYDQIPSSWIEPGIGGTKVKSAKIYPEKSMITKDEWEKVFDYFVQNAPRKLKDTTTVLPIKVGIPNFVSRSFVKEGNISPLIQSLAIKGDSESIYFAEMDGAIHCYDATGRQKSRIDDKRFIVDMQFEGESEEILALDMGSRLASDASNGSLISYRLNEAGYIRKVRIQNLMRPVSFARGQLDDDDDQEVIICEYGNLLGQLAIYDPKLSAYDVTVLNNDDGYICVELEDIDSDGDIDIVALQGNGDEGVDIFRNNGGMKFVKERILRFLPTNGSTHLNLVDFNQDGQLDILYSSGDNGDYSPINKPYHGVYLYMLENGSYVESFFLPMLGVYQAEAIDFDQDGDLDIVAVSFHPDFSKSPEGSFIYFQNDGENRFWRYTISQFDHARWMRFKTVDIEGDGDQDILLTAMNIKTPEVPHTVSDKWRDAELPVLLIENRLYE